MTFFLAKKQVDEKELITISLGWSLIAASLVTASLLFFPNDYFSTIPYNRSIYSFLFISGTLLTTYFSGLFFAKRQFFYPHLIPAVTNIVVSLFGAWVLITRRQSMMPLTMTIYFASFIINGIVLSFLYHSMYSLKFLLRIPHKGTAIKLFRYSALALVTNIVSFLAYRVDYWILKGFSPQVITGEALGNYIQVAKLVQLFLFAPTIVATIVFPASAARMDSDLNPEFKKMIWRVLLLNATACVVLLLSGRWLFILLYGKSFSLMYPCFVFSIPAILAISVTRILASHFAGTDRVRYNLFGGLVALVIITILNFWLIPFMGINGAALADSVGYISFMIFLLMFSTKKRIQ